MLFATAVGTTASMIKLSAIFWRRLDGAPPGPLARQVENAGTLRVVALHLGPALLAVSCVATGVFPRFWQTVVHRLLQGGVRPAVAAVPKVYTAAGIVEALVVGVLGAGLYLALKAARGKRVLARIKALPSSIDGAAFALVAGFVVLGSLALL
jgi:hypothetical protein